MAIVLAHLEAPVAADVLQLLPAEYQEEIVYRIATLGPVSNEALDDLEQLLLRGSTSKKQGAASQRGGTIEAAAIMNNVRKENEQRIIKAIAKRDKMIAQTIEEEMFVFDNLIDMDDKNMGTLMRTIDSSVLVVALKGANDMLKGKIFGSMSARAAQAIADEIEERGPIRLAEVMDAQKLIIATARRMADAGTIMLGGKGNDFV
jgi:flagellar motor switch protein FliG